MLETCSAKDIARRKSLVSLQLHRKPKTPKEYVVLDSVGWEQAWELLKKMANNPECIDSIVSSVTKLAIREENTSSFVDQEMFDGNMGALLHRMIHQGLPLGIYLAEEAGATSTGSCEFCRYDALISKLRNTTGTIIDTGLVYDESFDSDGDQNSTVDHVFVYGLGHGVYSPPSSPTTNVPSPQKPDLMKSFTEMDPCSGGITE
ncbi:hypothetical protein TELCIR_06012 [Teladorsagia circumcincta]|uniref:Uncharacterized protein n=1 Tax=Teladorsagia circumcincta TaxID=45464 RepID=A0A2G9UP89_TELCI|nr:hypothetical protein TELCIR_06012 [Teladorsagia circumcincta]